MKIRKTALIICLFYFPAFALAAAGTDLQPYVYTQVFDDADPFGFWASNGEYTVHFKGLSDERAFSGGKSFKLDVSFDKGSWFYWSIPVNVPAEGELKFSGRVFVAEESAGRAGLGVNYRYSPTTHTGVHTFGNGEKGEWSLIEGDAVAHGSTGAGGVIPRHVWRAKGENVGVYVDRIGLFLRGRPGDRMVVYVDDIRLEGNVPREDSFRAEIGRRWAPVAEAVEDRISRWESAIGSVKGNLEGITGLSPGAEEMRQKALEGAARAASAAESAKRRGFINLREQTDTDSLLKQIEKAGANLASLAAGRVLREDLHVYVVTPVSSVKILPFNEFLPGLISDSISVSAAPGEYIPGSFVVRAFRDFKGLRAEWGALEGERGIIPADKVDIKAVKCWYQSGSAWRGIGQNFSRRVLVPELLLNDASLVKVDHETEHNFIRLDLPGGEKYVNISEIDDTYFGGRQVIPVEEFPVKDSPILLPVDVAEGANKQFWVTVKIPENADAGLYSGEIRLSEGADELGKISLEVRVLPIKLLPPYYTSSIYYRGRLHPDWPDGSISSDRKSAAQLRAELENMYSHGVTNPICYQGLAEPELFRKYLDIREEVGMGGRPLYLVWGAGTPRPDLARISKALEAAGEYGIPEVYFYGRDEARGERLTEQRPGWKAIREIGGKVFTAGYRDSNFPLMGDIQDLLICAGHPCREEAARWHSAGHEIWCYANPQGGVEDPEVYRRNYGFLLWKYNYDGAATYAYQHAFGNIWNDFSHPGWRDHNFTYPTVDGVIDTIAWEGYREAVDDARYLTTLLSCIEEAKASGDAGMARLAVEAEEYLDALETDRDLDEVRGEIIDYILGLTGKR